MDGRINVSDRCLVCWLSTPLSLHCVWGRSDGETAISQRAHTRTHSCSSPQRHTHCSFHHHDRACTQCIHTGSECIELLRLTPIEIVSTAPLISYLGCTSSCVSLWERIGHYHFITVSSFFNLKVKISQWLFSLQRMFPYSNVNHYSSDFETCHFYRNYLWSLFNRFVHENGFCPCIASITWVKELTV